MAGLMAMQRLRQRRLAQGQRVMQRGCASDTGSPCAGHVHVEREWLCPQQVIVYRGDLDAASVSFFMTGLISSWVKTRSPITIASSPIARKASHDPSASAGLMSTPSSANLQVGARKPDAIDVPLHRAFTAQGLADGFPVRRREGRMGIQSKKEGADGSLPHDRRPCSAPSCPASDTVLLFFRRPDMPEGPEQQQVVEDLQDPADDERPRLESGRKQRPGERRACGRSQAARHGSEAGGGRALGAGSPPP